MPRVLRCSVWAVGIAFLATSAATQAQDASDDEARARFSAGEIAYAAARYEEALADFQRAYDLSERPELLYNIGLSAERLRRDDVAVAAFERFLELLPEHENAEQVRTRLALLQRVGTTDEPPDEVPDEVTTAGGPSRVGPWVLGLTGGALLVGGGVLLAVALGDRSEVEGLNEPTPWPQLEEQVDSVPRRSGAGIALLAAGGAAVVGAIIWRVITPAEPAVTVSAGRDGVFVHGTF